MRGKRAKWIRKQLQEGNASIFLAVRDKVGNRTENMSPNSVYKIAKKMWTSSEADKKLWMKEIKVEKSQDPNHLTTPANQIT